MLVSISDFARERGIEPQAVSRWINRHEELQKHLIEQGQKKLFERDGELYKILEEKYPYPKPTVIINGLDPDEERELRTRLADSNEALAKAREMMIAMQNELTEQKLLLAEKEHGIALLEERGNLEKQLLEAEKANLKSKNAELEEKLQKLENRSFFERIFNKGI